jgi:hypothetical protein
VTEHAGVWHVCVPGRLQVWLNGPLHVCGLVLQLWNVPLQVCALEPVQLPLLHEAAT